MTEQKLKLAFIFVLYKTYKSEVERLKKEVKKLNIPTDYYKLYFIDNTKNNLGYGAGVNKGIKRGLKDKADLFIIANPDISLLHLRGVTWLEAARHFDIWGYVTKQKGEKYYGGKIDKLRLSGGLIKKMPKKRYLMVDFVSGSFMVIKKIVIEKIGYFDESYFMYYEDVDYCLRAKKAGFKVGIDSNYIYDHYEISGKINALKKFYLAKSRLKFFIKYADFKQKVREFIRLPKTIIEELPSLFVYLSSNKFLLNFFSLNFSSVIVKLTSFINFLFLIRFLTASEYGIYSLVWTQIMILSPLADFGTTTYGVVYLPKEKRKNYQSLLNFRIFVSFIVFIVTLFLPVVLYKGSSKIYGYILITSSVIFTNMASGSYFILNAVNNRLYISSRNSIIFNILLLILTATSLFFFRKLLAVFIVIFIFYNLYTLLNLFFIKKEYPLFRVKFEIKYWKEIFGKLYLFVLIGFFSGLYSRLDLFLLKLFKGETEVGIYSAGSKFLEGLLFIAASYNVTAAPILARLSNNAYKLRKKIIKDIFFLLFIGLSTVTIIFLFSPYFLVHIYKKSYIYSIPVLKIVIFALPFILLNSILLNLLYVFKKSHFVLLVFIFQASVNFCLNYFLIPKYSYIASSYITVFSEAVNFIILLLIVRYVWKKTYENIC